jgi:hypothetical protein
LRPDRIRSANAFWIGMPSVIGGTNRVAS